MMVSRHARTLRTIPFLIAARHCERSAAIEGRLVVATAVFVLTLAASVQAKYSGGSGTAQDPYQIATAADLIALGETPADYGKHFVLTANIDLDPKLPGRKVFDRAVIAPDTDPTKDYFQGTPFTGVFDGNGHTISHLTITGGGYLGLFGQLASAAEVRNLGVVDGDIGGSGDCVGGLVGSNWGTVTDCHSTGTASGKDYVGGLVGYNWGTVTDCHSTGAVSGRERLGGLVGANGDTVTQCYSTAAVRGSGGDVGGLVGTNYGWVSQCHSTGAVSGTGTNWYVGGLVGDNYRGTVSQCYSTGTASGGDNVGGLVGANGDTVTQCYSTGAVVGRSAVGGLVGLNYKGTVSQCYSTGSGSGTGNIGGLVGANGDTVTQCYSTAAVRPGGGGLVGWNTGSVTQCYSAGAVSGKGGGLVGSNAMRGNDLEIHIVGVVTGSFWDIQGSGQATSAGGTGKTTAEMQTAKTFLDAGWDFVGETANGTADIWGTLAGKDYPRLAWEFWAFSPDPWNAQTDVIQSPVLSWLAGGRTVSHEVYFGQDKLAVTNATPSSLGIYRGRQPVEMTSYGPGVLLPGKTYYWRVDEVNEANLSSPWKGSVWTFSTSDFPVITVLDDFESYTNAEGSRIYETWKDGYYEDANHPGNVTGSTVGNAYAPFAEQKIVHGGKQSMPMDYDNVEKPWYSEAERTWATAQDWLVGGADTLTLYFRGKAGNSREPLYVGIEDSAGRIAVTVQPNVEAVLATEWQKWHIALADLRTAGVNVAAVKKMVIGVGDRKEPKPGGTGRIYIDDIRLTKRMP